MYAIIATGGKQSKVAEAKARRLSFTSIREKPAITRRTATDSSIRRLRLKRSTLNYDSGNNHPGC